MNYSFSTILMTILASNLIIALIAVCFYYEKIMLSTGYKLLAVFLVLTVFRFLFPFELPFTKSIYMPEIVSLLIAFIRHSFFNLGPLHISLWFVFECVWFIGFAVKLWKSVRKHQFFAGFITMNGREITGNNKVAGILRDACGKRKAPFKVFLVPGMSVPQIFGFFSPCILIPEYMDLESDEFRFAVLHEVQHYLHHDLLIKEIISFLCMLYWWNPLCSRFQRQVELALEMHVDESVVNNNRDISYAYGNAMLQIAEAALEQESSFQSAMTIGIMKSDCQDLTKRFYMLYRRESKINKPLFILLLLLTVSIYIGSYTFILEASYHDAVESNTDTIGLYEDFYLILLEDGTYDVYYKGVFVEHVSNLEFYRNVPVLSGE